MTSHTISISTFSSEGVISRMNSTNTYIASSLQGENICNRHSYACTSTPANFWAFHSWQLKKDISRSYEGGLFSQVHSSLWRYQIALRLNQSTKKLPHRMKLVDTSYYITSIMMELELALKITVASRRVDKRAYQGLRITCNLYWHYISIGTNWKEKMLW